MKNSPISKRDTTEAESLPDHSLPSQARVGLVDITRPFSTGHPTQGTRESGDDNHDPLETTVPQVLEFLQSGLDKGLSTSTLRRQVAAVSAVLGHSNNRTLAQHPYVRRFLRETALLNPPQVHRFPTQRLNLVLNALCKPPFEPLASCDMKDLTFKTLFLVEITLARRVSELRALSADRELCVFHNDKVVLRTGPAFVPKVNSAFHRSQEVVLPSFCPNLSHPKERELHCLDVRRALSYYIERMKAIRKSDSLFISFCTKRRGQAVSTYTLARWLKGCIMIAYKAPRVESPPGITAHSFRGVATSAAYRSFPSLETIRKAATWKSIHSFTKHYRVDRLVSADVAFGRAVLQSAVWT